MNVTHDEGSCILCILSMAHLNGNNRDDHGDMKTRSDLLSPLTGKGQQSRVWMFFSVLAWTRITVEEIQ